MLTPADVPDSHALRRGIVNQLEATVPAETHTWAMGHSPSSNSYEKDYKSRTLSEAFTAQDTDMDAISMDSEDLSTEELRNMANVAEDDILADMLKQAAIDNSNETETDLALDTVNKDLNAEDVSQCLHGVVRNHPRQRLQEGRSTEIQIFRPHRFDTLIDDTCNTLISDIELASQLLPFFKTMYPLERYGTLEPPPSTFICPICSEDQLTKSDV